MSLLVGCQCGRKKACDDLIHIAALRSTTGSTNIGTIRLSALQETASIVGAQGGLAFRSEQINCTLKRQQETLERIYNFRALMLKDDIRPPVLEEGRNELALDGCETVRASDRIFRIVLPPCFVTAPPNWRDYLWMQYCKPEAPDNTLLPRTREEAAIWNCYVHSGWEKGVEQANQIFGENLLRLQRDYKGMILYKNLLAQNMVTPPYVCKTELGVTGDANELRVNDRILRISATSQLNTNPDSWCPVVARTKPGDTCAPLPPPCGKKCARIIRKKSCKNEPYLTPSSYK